MRFVELVHCSVVDCLLFDPQEALNCVRAIKGEMLHASITKHCQHVGGSRPRDCVLKVGLEFGMPAVQIKQGTVVQELRCKDCAIDDLEDL